MNENIRLSIVIVSFNTKDILKTCLKLVFQYTKDISHEVLVVDNDSRDDSVEMLRKEFPQVRLLINKENLGFAGGNNPALKEAKGEFILLLNSDAYLEPNVLERTLAYMQDNEKCGILGVTLKGLDGKRQPSARKFPNPWNKFTVMSGLSHRLPNSRVFSGPDYSWWDHSSIKKVDWVPGAYFLVRSQVFDDIGYLDELYFLYYEETDFCLQAKRAGWDVIYFPEAEVIHLGGESSKTTNAALSDSGKQLIHLRIESEHKYCWKNFGPLRVFAMAWVEMFWLGCVNIKNTIIMSEDSALKISSNKVIIGLIKNSLKRKTYKKN